MEEKLIRYIRGKINSEAELREILDWIEASAENKKKYNELKNLWVLTGLDHVKNESSKKFFKEKTIQVFSIQKWERYAAIFFLAFLSGALSIYYLSQEKINLLTESYNEIQVPNGEKSIITLYDGTKVWLNSGTKLKYPVAFNQGKRDVFIEGEAFFDVAKDKKRPFIVHSGEMEIQVLGTKFDVYSYPDEDLISTTLEEGSVKISIAEKNKNFNLNPGEQFEYSKSSKIPQLTKVDTRLYTSWKENILRFENAPLSEILKKMERWYGVKFIIDKNLDTSETYTTSIQTESLREILKVLSLTTEMKYEINENIVEISKP